MTHLSNNISYYASPINILFSFHLVCSESVQIEGNNAHADDAIMLDKDGYVSETNATNIVSLHKTLSSNMYGVSVVD